MIHILTKSNKLLLKENAMGFSSLEITIFCLALLSLIFSVVMWFAKVEIKIVPRRPKKQKDADRKFDK